MKLRITTLVFGDEDDMNLYHSLDQDPELDLLNQVRVTFEGDFTIHNIHQLKGYIPNLLPRNPGIIRILTY